MSKKNDWSKVTLKQFLELQDLLEIQDENERLFAIGQLFFGDSILDSSLSSFFQEMKSLSFLKEEIPVNHLVKSIKVNDREYRLDGVLGKITTSQYIDYTTYLKNNDIAKILSVFFIPKGHKYNDGGYELEEVMEDMLSLPMDVVNSTAFFFSRQFQKFIKIFQSYSIKRMKQTNLPSEKKKEIEKIINSAFYLTC